MNVFAVLREAVTITIFVFSMMVLVDWLNVRSRGGMTTALRGRKWREYLLSSFLGSTPGCLGAFMNVSMYVHGLIGFGALVGGMIATSGDEAYVMLSLFPGKALLLFGGLFIGGIVFGPISDWVAKRLHMTTCEECSLQQVHTDEIETHEWRILGEHLRHPSALRVSLLLLMTGLLILAITGVIGPHTWSWMRITLVVLLGLGALLGISESEHYLKEHIINHVLRRHTVRVFLWTFGALLLLSFLPSQETVQAFIQGHIWLIFLSAGLLGIIPESGPHMIFVMMYASGIIPFSVLFVSSFVQDGHGMLPLFSVSVKDSLRVKAFNLVFGLAVGGVLYAVGI
ncbi:MAG: putative manganese transporter [Candidatus Bipolaricaulota bacterium]|nr:putative manganese transporter [Candidatus Bipolaricaulota bacterium]